MTTSRDLTDDPENVNYVIKWWVTENKFRYHHMRCRGTLEDFQHDVWCSLLSSLRDDKYIPASLLTVITHHCHWVLFRDHGKQFAMKRKFQLAMLHSRPILPSDICGGRHDADNYAYVTELETAVLHLMRTLTWRQAAILRARYGLFGDKEMTLEQVGRVLKLTRETIRQAESKAINRLQHHTRAKKLRPFLDEYCTRTET